MTRAETILLILYDNVGVGNEYDRPFVVCQLGMAQTLNTSRTAISLVLCDLEKKGLVSKSLRHAGGGKRTHCYDLTPTGIRLAQALKKASA